ncbi:MAG TPA: methyltransferase domain-containing protein [Actinomycetota bacterium]|nr:methyltransferase domain-containing protein [Actinomycetota bacterium]
MHDEKRAARRWFDRRAGAYEDGFTARWRDPIQKGSFEALELKPGDRLLDVGCGTGAASRRAAAVAGSVVGADLSSEMLKEARQLARGIDNVTFVQADAEALPLEDASFTAILCTNSFHHYPNPAAAIGEMARVLVPGGRLLVGDPCADVCTVRVADLFLKRMERGHIRLYRSHEMAAFIYGAGLTGIRVRRLFDGAMTIYAGTKAG